MLKKKVLLISNPKLKKYYKKIITTYGSKLENIDESKRPLASYGDEG